MRAHRPLGRHCSAAVLLATWLSLLLAGRAVAQPPPGPALPSPRLFVVTPAGGKVGSTMEVTFTGQDLDEPQGLLFSQSGIKVEPILPPPAPPADAKKPQPKQAPKVAVSKFKVTIPADTPVGIHDVRLVNKWGVSNPRAFVVGDLAEVLEKEPNNDVGQAQRVDMNTTVSGAISAPTDVDYFVFAGKKGQRAVISCLASSIDSRLHPGLELYDSAGKSLGENHNYQGTDALVDCVLPADGDFYVRLFEFTYTQGGPEYFYRLSISTAPWIDAVLPPVVERGKTAQVTAFGRNLPGGQLDPSAVVDGRMLEKLIVHVDVPKDPLAWQRLAYNGHVPPQSSALDGFEFRLRNASGWSNAFLLTYAAAPVVLDNGAHDKPETAQEVALPCEIAGWIEKRRDRDWYAFKAKKGEVYTIEVFGDRLGSPLDMYFVLRNPASKQDMIEVDDNPETLTPGKFFTRTDDPPRYRFVVPADGAYQLMVTSHDADTVAGPRRLYRVRITPEQPDFRLIVMPAANSNPEAAVLRQGGNQYYDVFAWRLDGWNGEITLTAEGLPQGVTCQPQALGKGLKQTALVLSAAADAAAWTGPIQIKGTATINGQTVMREARPASITWPIQPPQPNIPAVSRLDRSLVLAVRDKAPFALTAAIDKATLLQGEKGKITLNLVRHWPEFKGPLQVTLTAQPANLVLPPNLTVNNNQPLNLAAGKNEATLVVDARANAVPGIYNIVLRGQGQVPFNKDAIAKQKVNVNVSQPATPIVITVLPKQVGTITLATPNPTVKVGMHTEVLVKIARQYDFTGEFKVQLVLPPNVKGLSAQEVTIPADKNETKLVLKAAADAAPGSQAGLIVRATALVNGKHPTTQETKLSVNVVK